MEYTDTDKGMTPEEIKRQKKREWQREYRRKHPERVHAHRKAWREKNPEKNKESQRKSERKYYLAHREERQAAGRAAARKYYAEHREEVLARQKIYKSQCREKARECARECRVEIATGRKAKAVAMSIRRKEQYRQNSQPARNRAAIYYARAMASRQMASGVCPAFRFVMELKAAKNIGYKLCGGAKYSFVQRAVNGCPALSSADANLCPMVANPDIQQKQMLAACTMPDVFRIPLAWPAIRAHAVALRIQSEK